MRLSGSSRRSIPKLGIKSLGFADITLGFAKSNPQFVPSYQDIDVLTANMEFVKQLQQGLLFKTLQFPKNPGDGKKNLPMLKKSQFFLIFTNNGEITPNLEKKAPMPEQIK